MPCDSSIGKTVTGVRAGVVSLARRAISRLGGTLLSRAGYDQLVGQRNCAVRQLAHIQSGTLSPGLTAIVFSKDRPLQLFALLHSYLRHVVRPIPLTVIFKSSTVQYEEAYREVQAELAPFLEINLLSERESFRATLLDVLDQVPTRNLIFFVDDIVFIRPLDLDLARQIDPSNFILSLRHGPHLTKSYTASTYQPAPRLSPSPYGSEVLVFRWFERENEWSDPWSVDGQVLSTAEIVTMSRVSMFLGPNSYEGALKSFNNFVGDRQGLCFTESKIINLAINRVQNEVANRSGRVSAEFLLTQWQNGLAFDTSVVDLHVPISPHEEHSLPLVLRSNLLRALEDSGRNPVSAL